MPYDDFKALFIRKSRNGESIMDITQNGLDTIYNNPRTPSMGNTMSGDWDLFDLVGEDELTYPKNDRNKGFKKI